VIARGGVLLGVLLAGLAMPARAHLLNMTRVSFAITGARMLDVQVDVDLSLLLGDHNGYRALLLQSASEQEPRMRELGQQVLKEIGLKLDGEEFVFPPKSWQLPDTPPEKIGDQTIAAMTTFHYGQTLPAGVRELTVLPGMLAKIEFPLAYTFSIPAESYQLTRWLELPGAGSRVLRLPELVPAAGPAPLADPVAAVVIENANERDVVVGASASGHHVEGAGSTPVSPTPAGTRNAGPRPEEFTPFELQVARVVSTVIEHLRLGFRHIFPDGVDHILFVLGLFFLAPRWRPLLTQTTAFTLAHTTTLGLSAYGILSLPARVVEPLIALSIAYVAVENIWKPKLNAARIMIVFAFGLLHGLGFASSLSEVPMPRDQFFTALLAFNLGVDFGQLAVIGTAFLLVGWFRKRDWYWKGIAVPVCVVIAAVGGYWTVTRIFV
jgi:hypothetical protein